jgi:hypothetical protein
MAREAYEVGVGGGELNGGDEESEGTGLTCAGGVQGQRGDRRRVGWLGTRR